MEATTAKKASGTYQRSSPPVTSTSSAPRSDLSFLLDKSTCHIPREFRLTARTPSTVATLKKRTEKIEPPMGLSLEMVGTMFTMGPSKNLSPYTKPRPKTTQAKGSRKSRFSKCLPEVSANRYFI